MRYELVAKDRSTHIKNMVGVLGCTLDFGYYTDLKVSGTLEVDECDYIDGAMLRIWYEPTLDGETEHICLGTFFVSTMSLEYSYGRYSGTMDISSVLVKYTKDVCETDTVLAKGRSAKGWWWSAMRWCGATGTILGDVADVTFSKANIIEFGKPKLDVLNAIADALGCQVGVTEKGVISLTRYVSPQNRGIAYTMPIGNKSVTLRGVSYDDGRGDAVNRCVVKFDNAEHSKGTSEPSVIYGKADLDSDSPYSFARTGVRITNSYTVDEMSPRTKERADEIAQRYLDMNSKPSATWQMRCLYLPFTIGDVIRFRYQDSPSDDGIDVDALVSEVSMDIGGTSIVMEVTLKEIRRRYA
ncbi:MAG: hypothetical protein KBT28_12430 [Bacteroidales bacterium]|nr:hypothetical protein [Candidatus Colimorpha merdihippi]